MSNAFTFIFLFLILISFPCVQLWVYSRLIVFLHKVDRLILPKFLFTLRPEKALPTFSTQT